MSGPTDPAPAVAFPDRAGLLGRTWSFGTDDGHVYATQLRLLPDGGIGGYRHDNEAGWELDADGLALLDRGGRPTTRFDRAGGADGALVLEGRYLGSGGRGHRLVEVAPIGRLPDASEAVALRAAPGLRRRRNLVVVRAGDRSLHRDWTRDLEPSRRSWDLALSWYGNPEGWPDDPDAQYHAVQDQQGKFLSLWHLLHPGSPVWAYDFVAFPDDDLEWSWSGINRAFEIMREFGLLLAQPCLRESGHTIHPITRHQEGLLLRFTSFVEVMTPIFSREALALCAPTFGLSRSGFGIDHVWPKLLGEKRSRVAVLDASAVVHTRPPATNYDLAAAIAEGRRITAAYRAPETYLQYGGIWLEGRGAE